MSFTRRIVVATVAATTTVVLAACGQSTAPSAATIRTSVDPQVAAATVTGTVWVANEEGDSLSVIDASTGRVVATVDGIDSPHNVQTSPDGSTVWAVSGEMNALVAIDAASLTMVGSAPTGRGPAHVVLSPDGARTFVTSSGDGTLTAYRSTDLEPLGTADVGAGPHGLRPSADGTVLVVANTTDGTIDLVDTATLSVSATIPVGDSPVQVAVAPDGRFAYVSLAGEDAVAKVDLTTLAVVSTVEVPSAPVQLYLTADGSTLLSADQGTETAPGRSVSVIDPADMTLSASITTGAGPHGVVIDPTGTFAWVTNLYDDTVSVLDLTAREVIATVPVGDRPNGISFSAQAPSPATPTTVEITVPDHAAGDDTTDGHAEHDEAHD